MLQFSQWKWPRVRRRDKCLHIIFIFNLLIMIGCAIATIMCFLSDRDNAAKFPKDKVKLTAEEVITLTCGVMFFVAFFIAMTVEIKARHTLYKLFLRFITHNTEWTLDSYDPSKDPMYKRPLPASQVWVILQNAWTVYVSNEDLIILDKITCLRKSVKHSELVYTWKHVHLYSQIEKKNGFICGVVCKQFWCT